jgi:hypothetical protein
LLFDKALLSMAGSIVMLFLPIKGYWDRYLDRKEGVGDAIGRGNSGGGHSNKSVHLLVE